MTTRHEAFGRKRHPLRERDPHPHTLMPNERQHVLDRLESGSTIQNGLVRKLLRLYDERTAACISLLEKLPGVDPELG